MTADPDNQPPAEPLSVAIARSANTVRNVMCDLRESAAALRLLEEENRQLRADIAELNVRLHDRTQAFLTRHAPH